MTLRSFSLSVGLVLALLALTFASEKTYPLDGRIRLLYQTANGTYVNPGLNKLQIQGIYSRTTASLSGNELELSSPITADGDFIFFNVPPGAYLLRINCPSFYFPALRVDVSKKEEGKLRAKLFATNQPYFEEERQLGLWGMLWNNKMLWVMGFMMLMSWGMQFLADPEMMAELRGKDVAPPPQVLMPSFKLPKAMEQLEAEAKEATEKVKKIKSEEKDKPVLSAREPPSALDRENERLLSERRARLIRERLEEKEKEKEEKKSENQEDAPLVQ